MTDQTSSRPTPIDAADRARLQDELDATFFVEAGAGTGKTTALVARIVAMVVRNKLDLDRLAAITFTVAAAAELRSRIRRELERAAQDENRSEAERARCARAVGEVDLATIQTIHAFAGTLLRTFPIEARLPPGFQVLDPFQADLAFDERFRAWLWDDVPSEFPEALARRDAVRRALLLGLTFDQLRQLAAAFEGQADQLTSASAWPAPPPPEPVRIANQWGQELIDLSRFFPHSKLGEAEDPTIAECRRHEQVIQRLANARSETEALQALQSYGKIRSIGRQSDWLKEPSGQNALKSIKEVQAAANEAVATTLESHRRTVLGAILGYVRDFTLASANDRRRAGVATFHDLLTWARDLLRDQPDVRRRARLRFSRIFVDEFQDTDPLQAEIVWFLACDDATMEVEVWTDVVLEPGKLFIVGDPKQSIYRFRRADIGLYLKIYGNALAESRAQLSENFRSVPEVIDWVNYQFALEMQREAGVQAPYVPLHVPLDLLGRGGVHVVGGQVDGGADLAREQEAAAVALLAHNAVAGSWSVRDRFGHWGKARFRDICVLLRARTNVRALEEAFDRLNVPYRMEGGFLVLETQEVRDLLACLRAIDDPSDQVALVAALRSPAFACSDVDLLDWVGARGTLDYLSSPEALPGTVADAFRSLRAFHAARVDRSVAATTEAFIRERMLAAGAFDGPRARQTWRRLRYIVGQARLLSAAGRPTLRSLVDWLESQQRARIRDVESPLPESDEDAVRVMTIHGAKGLEFPIAVVTGLNATKGGGSSGVEVLTSRDGPGLEVKVGEFQTVGFTETKPFEERLEAAEQVRLFYVAATRARDHLILPLFYGKRAGNSPAARYLQALDEFGDTRWLPLSLDEVPGPGRSAETQPPDNVESPEEHEAAETVWLNKRMAAIAAAAATPITTATQLARAASANVRSIESDLEDDSSADELPDDGSDPDGPPAEPTQRFAKQLGRAVHATLAEIGPAGGELLAGVADRAARKQRIAGFVTQVREMAAAALASPSVVAARSRPHWCEVPLGREIAGRILVGKIDLLVEQPDGSLQIIDYKTGAVDPATIDEHASRFRIQGGAYALLLEAVTGKKVSSFVIVFAGPNGGEVELGPVEDLIEEARARLAISPQP